VAGGGDQQEAALLLLLPYSLAYPQTPESSLSCFGRGGGGEGGGGGGVYKARQWGHMLKSTKVV
jgi:hypothetical protein